MPSAKEVVNDSRREIVKEIIENMQKGYIFSEERWNKEALRPQNPVSGAKYQGSNRMRLAFQAIKQEYDDPRWVTFLQAKEKGWKIKDKEKGTLCEKWIWTQEKIEKDEEGNVKKVIVDRKIPIVNYFIVFNGSQIEGIPKIQVEPKKISKLQGIVNNLISSSECPIIEVAQEKSFYSPLEDKIVLPLRKYFKNDSSFLATLLHEMAHSTGHETRLNRNICNIFGSVDYAKEELRAELSTIFMEADLNLDLEEANKIDHSNYLKSWISVLEDNPDELFRACNDSSKASERLIENYKMYIERSQNQVKQVELVVLDDRKYGKNSLWKITLDELNMKNMKGQHITNITNEELKFYTGYIKENYLTNLIYNSLTEYLEKNNISFEDLVQEENEELVGG